MLIKRNSDQFLLQYQLIQSSFFIMNLMQVRILAMSHKIEFPAPGEFTATSAILFGRCGRIQALNSQAFFENLMMFSIYLREHP